MWGNSRQKAENIKRWLCLVRLELTAAAAASLKIQVFCDVTPSNWILKMRSPKPSIWQELLTNQTNVTSQKTLSL